MQNVDLGRDGCVSGDVVLICLRGVETEQSGQPPASRHALA